MERERERAREGNTPIKMIRQISLALHTHTPLIKVQRRVQPFSSIHF